MFRERLGLSTEPQPVFVGGSFTLIMLVMQIYIFQIAPNGNMLAIFNNPVVLAGVMMAYFSNIVDKIVWAAKIAAPVIMLVCALAYGKRYAKYLAIPCAVPALFVSSVFVAISLEYYYISYIIYAVTAVFYLITAFGLKSVKPFIVYCILVCVGVVAATLLKYPPFVLYDGTIYLSELIYFVVYHIVVANFARAIPMQAKLKKKK